MSEAQGLSDREWDVIQELPATSDEIADSSP